MKLTDFEVLSFDCYGTLIDWESGILKNLRPLTKQLAEQLLPDEILSAHGELESAQQEKTPQMLYRDILASVYEQLSKKWGVSVEREACERYGLSVGEWEPFEDTVEALRYLKKHFKLVILSNVDNRNFADSNKRLKVEFDYVFTAEDIGSYKPADRNFEYMLEHLGTRGVRKEQILHTAESLFHDHGPANRFGIRSCWIHRRHEKQGFGATKDPGKTPTYDFRFTSLGEMAVEHRKSMQ